MLLGEIEVDRPAAAGAAGGDARPRAAADARQADARQGAADGRRVSFLYNCYATDVLHDAEGNLCGIVMANRAGRQAVLAKTIIDATDTAVVARLAGARFRPFTPGEQTFKRVVIGGEVQQAKNMTARVIEPAFVGPYPNKAQTSSGLFPIIEYTLKLPMADESDAAWAKADQQARTLTYHPEQQFTSDVLFMCHQTPCSVRRRPDESGFVDICHKSVPPAGHRSAVGIQRLCRRLAGRPRSCCGRWC